MPGDADVTDEIKPVGAPPARQVVAAVIGNALEWYDFTIFGVMIVVISRLFFPPGDPGTALLLAAATFGAGFVARPIGGLLIGMYADRKGRKAALQLIMALMTLSVMLIAFVPTYAEIGILAPVIIFVARLLQGFATGGEFASATAYLLETAPPGRRGLYSAWQMFGQSLAVLCGMVISFLVTHYLAAEALDAWGWRLPFLIGLLIGPVGLWIRQVLQETEAFQEAKRQFAGPRAQIHCLRAYLPEIGMVMGLTVFGTVSFYGILVYMPTFAHRNLNLSLPQAFLAQAVAVAVMTLLIPCAGWLSDRLGRKPILMGSIAFIMVVIFPLLTWVLAHPSFSGFLLSQLILCAAIGLYFGPISAVVAEQFPAAVRSTGLAIGYNLAVMIFGGFAQVIFTLLIQLTGSPIAPFIYVFIAGAIGLLAASFVKEATIPGAAAQS